MYNCTIYTTYTTQCIWRHMLAIRQHHTKRIQECQNRDEDGVDLCGKHSGLSYSHIYGRLGTERVSTNT